jgi:uncharacterized OsmC-like protein
VTQVLEGFRNGVDTEQMYGALAALGLSDEVRNGFTRIRVSFEVQGDAPEEKLREIVERARRRAAVYDMVTNGVAVELSVDLP